MALPINIDGLLSGRIVESERLEFKAGFNPEVIVPVLLTNQSDTFMRHLIPMIEAGFCL